MRHALPRTILRPPDRPVWAPPLELEDLVVRLEADGVTSSVAQSEYGFPDVWKLAEAHVSVAMTQPPANTPQQHRAAPWKDFFKGMAFATPMLLCCVMALVFKVGLWGGPLSGNEAVAVAIAAIAAFVATGGFIQVIGRQGHFYKHGQQWALCARSCWSAVLLAAATLLMIVGFAFAANAYFQWLPLRLFALCAAFTLCIAAYLLVSGILYVLDGELMIAFGTLLGTAVSAALFLIARLPLLISQIIGLALAVATFSVFAQLRFLQLGSRAPIKVPLPPPGRLLFMLWPYFVYGTLYYSFLFADRIVAWTAHTQLSALPLQFRGEYETALDVCLFAFVLQVGWIHAGLVRFYRIVGDEQRRISIRNRKNLRRTLARFYASQMGVLATLCIASTSIVLWGINSLPSLKAILLFRVAVLALAGIPFAAGALWNIALLFALSRPILAIIATAWGLAANVSTGYLLSRLFTYDYAVIGFDVGALTMAVVSAWSCRRILSNFDYHFFAAAA